MPKHVSNVSMKPEDDCSDDGPWFFNAPDAVEDRMAMTAQSPVACANSALSGAGGRLFLALCYAHLLSLSSGRRRFMVPSNLDATSV